MNQWTTIDGKLCKTFVFKDFPAALAWMVKAGFVIEKLNHHPEWKNVYNKVEVALCTHDDGNKITDKDKELAAKLDEV
jgi:4a-hydroxytetrahydrobiopterin dehydratase